MLIPHESALLFIEGYKKVLFRILADAGLLKTKSTQRDLVTARTYASQNPGLIGKTIDALRTLDEPLASSVAGAVRNIQIRRWIYLRQTKRHAVFLDTETESAFEVRALTDPLNVLAHDPPMFVETGVFAYEGMVVCDGLLLTPILIGRSYQDTFNADYTRLRKAGHLYKTATQFNHLFMLDSPDNA